MPVSAVVTVLLHDFMVAYLSNNSLTKMTKRERLCELGGLESLLNPCVRLDTQLHPGMDPRVGSSLECGYSVTHVSAQGGLVYPMCEME